MKNNLIFILIMLFSHSFNAQNRTYSFYEGKEVSKLSITEKEVKYSSKDETIIYNLEKQSTDRLKVNSDNFSFTISFERDDTINILPFNLVIKTNTELYKYLKNSILIKNEIQKIGLLFYPINRFYDNCCLYFNHDIFIKDWDQDMYSPKFKILSVEELNEKKTVMKGTYQYKGERLDKINYYRDDEGNLFEFYSECFVKKAGNYNQYNFKYYPSNEKYILKGKHYRDKNGHVMKAIYRDENMSDVSKTDTKTFNYSYPKVQVKSN